MSIETKDMDDTRAYIDEIGAWRKKVEADLRAPHGWLSLTGLYPLREGDNTIGSDAASAIVLPPSAPARLGVIQVTGDRVHLSLTADAPVSVNGQAVREADLEDSAKGTRAPTPVVLGTITFFIHTYGPHRAIRVKDSANPAIHEFAGRIWYEVKPEYRVRGRFVTHDAPKVVHVDSMVDATLEYTSIGTLEFELHGQPLRLTVFGQPEREAELRGNVLFRDATAGVETYAAVRTVGVSIHPDHSAEIDFNRAQNMPCAFTPYATCPLPPRENILSARIEAGERYDNRAH